MSLRSSPETGVSLTLSLGCTDQPWLELAGKFPHLIPDRAVDAIGSDDHISSVPQPFGCNSGGIVVGDNNIGDPIPRQNLGLVPDVVIQDLQHGLAVEKDDGKAMSIRGQQLRRRRSSSRSLGGEGAPLGKRVIHVMTRRDGVSRVVAEGKVVNRG